MKKLALTLSAVASIASSDAYSAENIPEMEQEINTQELGIAERKEQIVALVAGDKYLEFNMTTGMMAYPLDNSDKKGGIILDETLIIEDENGKNDIAGLVSNFKNDLIELTYIGPLPNGPITDVEGVTPCDSDSELVVANIQKPGKIVTWVSGGLPQGQDASRNKPGKKNLVNRNSIPMSTLQNIEKCAPGEGLPQGQISLEHCSYKIEKQITQWEKDCFVKVQGDLNSGCQENTNQSTIFNVEYTKSTHPISGDNLVTPTGDLSNAAIIEYIEVNGERVNVNAMNYSFPGNWAVSGTSLNIEVKVAGKDALETYSA